MPGQIEDDHETHQQPEQIGEGDYPMQHHTTPGPRKDEINCDCRRPKGKQEACESLYGEVRRPKKEVRKSKNLQRVNTEDKWKRKQRIEPPRLSRRLRTLRGLEHEQIGEVRTRGA